MSHERPVCGSFLRGSYPSAPRLRRGLGGCIRDDALGLCGLCASVADHRPGPRRQWLHCTVSGRPRRGCQPSIQACVARAKWTDPFDPAAALLCNHIMNDRVTSADDTALWTRDEIVRLVSESGDAAETLSNLVRLIQERFAPTSARSTCSSPTARPGAGRHGRPAARERRPGPDAARRRAGGPGRRAAAADQSSKTRRRIRGSSTSARRAKMPYHSFLGVPLVDRGLLQGVLVVQTIEPRERSRRDEVRHADGGGRSSSAPIVSEARTLEQFVAPAYERIWALARNLWWSWDADAHGAVPRARPGPLAASWTTTRSRCCSRSTIDELRASAPASCVLHSRINYAYRRLQEYLTSTQDLGRDARRRPAGPAGRLLLGRVRPARVAADLLRRPGRPGRRPPQERLGPGHPAGRHRAVLRPGLLPPAARRRRLAAGRLHRRRRRAAADASRPSARRQAGHVTIETRSGVDRGARLEGSRSGATRCCCSTPTSRATSPRTAS